MPLLPGDSQRIEYAELVVWPGPPPAGMPLQDIPRIQDCCLHHHGFYMNKTGRYLMHQEANEVTSLSKEERLLFFGTQLSEDPTSSDSQEEPQAPSGTQTLANPNWPPGSPSWPTTMPAAMSEMLQIGQESWMPVNIMECGFGDNQQPESQHGRWR